LLDEFCNIGIIPEFNKKISTVRSRGIDISIVIQNIPQLVGLYPKDSWQELVGNCDTRIALGCTDIMTATYISELMGASTVEDNSIRKPGGFDGELDIGQESSTVTKRMLLNPDEILRLPHEQSIIIIRGKQPCLLNKFIYINHPVARNLKEARISDYTKVDIPQKEKVITEHTQEEKSEFKTEPLREALRKFIE
jgi:type IV secretion system protein VirD4